MKLIFIRHGDPDYVHDALTEKGKREAALLAKRVQGMKIDRCFLSPLGRAQQTAHFCIDEMGICGTTYDWLQEFSPRIHRPDAPDKEHICWDWLPEDWTKLDELYDFKGWVDYPVFREANVASELQAVYEGFGRLLSELGYTKEGRHFRVESSNNDTIVFFCHFGIIMVMLSFLFDIPVMPLWQSFLAPTTSVTTVVTEERREGIAAFRLISFGDTSHLEAGNEPVSFSGRFCECFSNRDERH